MAENNELQEVIDNQELNEFQQSEMELKVFEGTINTEFSPAEKKNCETAAETIYMALCNAFNTCDAKGVPQNTLAVGFGLASRRFFLKNKEIFFPED